MKQLFSTQNRPHLVIIFVALIARAVLGGLPLIGGIIGFVLLLVALFHVYKVAVSFMAPSAP